MRGLAMDEKWSHVDTGLRRIVLALRALFSHNANATKDGGTRNMEEQRDLEKDQAPATGYGQFNFILESLERNDYRVACGD